MNFLVNNPEMKMMLLIMTCKFLVKKNNYAYCSLQQNYYCFLRKIFLSWILWLGIWSKFLEFSWELASFTRFFVFNFDTEANLKLVESGAYPMNLLKIARACSLKRLTMWHWSTQALLLYNTDLMKEKKFPENMNVLFSRTGQLLQGLIVNKCLLWLKFYLLLL